MADISSKNFQDVEEEEKKVITSQRKIRGRDANDAKYVGLAISGGGIRSASVGLGVLQALNQHDKMKEVDYLSTVSGGGYIGSSLTWFHHLNGGGFPFSNRGMGARSSNSSNAVDFIRQHGNYLTPGDGLSGISLLANVLRNMLFYSAVYFGILVFLLFTAIETNFINNPVPPEAQLQQSVEITNTQVNDNKITVEFALQGNDQNVGSSNKVDWGFNTWAVRVLCAALVLMGVVILIYALVTFFLRSSRHDYLIRVFVQRSLGAILTLVIALLIIVSLPIVYHQIAYAAWLGGSTTTLGLLGAAFHFYQSQNAKVSAKLPSNLRIWVTALLLIHGLLLLAYIVAGMKLPESWGLMQVGVWVLLPSLLFGYVMNSNYFGIGRMYRDRLIETFLPNNKSVKSGNWSRATKADKTKLSDVCRTSSPGPYHLINCNVVLVDSNNAKFRGRGGDSFLLSPLFCGGDSTEWYETDKFLNNRMTLGTAMAISGAAANPNTGVAGKGTTRNRLISFLMAYFGLRLGYWARNPAAKGLRRLLASFLQPNLLHPGIVQGLLGQRLKENAGFLELSDGGHFENTGLYELARRKLDVIIISDAGADPDFTMADIGNAIEKIRVDFGYYIRFPDPNFDLLKVMPGSRGGTFFDNRFNLAERGFSKGEIDYGDDKKGVILLIKPTMIANLPGDLYAYNKANPVFPQQPTLDQFFDEVQLEAYRELGYQLCADMLRTNTAKNWF